MHEALVAKLREHVQLANFFGLEKAQSTTLIGEAADAIEELTGFVQEAERDRDEYRERLDKANDTIEELVCKEKFHVFLWNTIQPNEMEQYLAMYRAQAVQSEPPKEET